MATPSATESSVTSKRLVVRRHARVGKRGDVDRAQAAFGGGDDALFARREHHAHLAQLFQEHVHVGRTRPLHEHLPAGEADSGDEGGRLHPVGDGPVVGRAQLVDPLDFDAGGASAAYVRPHLDEHGGEVGDLRLAGGVLDHGRALGEHGGHQDVVRCGVARELEHDAGADEAVAVALDIAVLCYKARPEVLEGAQVEVDRTVAEVVAAGHRDPGGPVTGEKGAEHDYRGTHLLYELIRGDGGHLARDGDLEPALLAPALVDDLGSHGAQHV